MDEKINHKIVCENFNNLTITGVEKADNATPTHFSCVVAGKTMNIFGKDLSVKKLDITEGIVELNGNIEEIKYSLAKPKLLKRLFK